MSVSVFSVLLSSSAARPITLVFLFSYTKWETAFLSASSSEEEEWCDGDGDLDDLDDDREDFEDTDSGLSTIVKGYVVNKDCYL